MSKFQPSRSQVPVDERSVLATVPGLPWWGAVLTMLVFTAAGALASGEFAGANAGVLAMSVGAVVAVLAVRNRALFTAMVQPPLIIATAIPLYRWFSLPSPRKTSQILTDVLFPMISLFPWMFWTTVAVLVIGGVRLLQYRALTANARSAQRSSAASGAKTSASKTAVKAGAAKPGTAKPAAAAAAATTGDTTSSAATKKPAESAGLPIGDRIRAAFARLRPAPAAGAVGAAALVGDGGGRSERHQSRATAHRSSRAVRDRADRDRADRREPASAEADAAVRGRSSAARREDPRRELRRSEVRRDEQRRDSAARLARTREEIAARDAGAPATQINRVVRPDSGQIPRPPMPRRGPADDGRAMPRGARPRPAVAQGDRPRPGIHDSRELRHDEERRRIGEPQPRWRTPRAPEGRPESPAARAAAPADSRDYRREAHDIDRARGVAPSAPRAARERSQIPRDDFASLPRISGSRAAQPDLPSLTGDERPSRRGEAPSNPGRYEHYRPPRYRPQSEDTAVETNFRDDFAEPADGPRQIRRHRYKD
ncbi:Uncharacterised protein (plasmid) [Tsukamurella tyrosinosolvens]|uniref:DUF6542 domain-containing protein n=3 Tax=Tsukamurella tyrosinosolvens TaxID=57704 RepID=A0A1H4PFJ3_TSUTY|nr:DUF6542 domain-containing protein [Tsukamurella tyrosinosolvens]KXO97339.1 hypothetical protein AXK58_08970 [Tsukamurella tyrosinosolvens]SEC05974.1 hypothetical protein SAMN04489793_1424 [Tsukamurella tyrosinosolvens]VEH97291.1 Uncharacterised protein [Tsukamurella tyrosinosolvens]